MYFEFCKARKKLKEKHEFNFFASFKKLKKHGFNFFKLNKAQKALI